MQLALGLIETKGLVGAIEAADAMLKAADVRLISKERVSGALVLVKVEGEVAAVKSAVDAGAAAAQRVGQLNGVHIIPRPSDQIQTIIYEHEVKHSAPEPKKKAEKKVVKADKIFVEEKTPDTVKEGKAIEEVVKKKTDEPAPKAKVKPAEKKVEKPAAPKEEMAEHPLSKSGYIPSEAYLRNLNVHELRRFARGFENFPIKGREISRANRQELLDFFSKLR